MKTGFQDNFNKIRMKKSSFRIKKSGRLPKWSNEKIIFIPS